MKLLLSSLTLIFTLISLQASASNACHANTYPTLHGAQFFTSSAGDKMVHRMSGKEDAETILVFSNGLDKDMTQWNRVLSRLKAQHSDWAFVQTDLLGQGEAMNLAPYVEDEISYQRQILLLKEFFSSKGWQNKNLILVGHSYGGGIAARFAAENPGWVKQNVLIAPFVDNLEIHQAGMEGLSWSKKIADFFGLTGVYDSTVQLGGDIGLTSSWYLAAARNFASKARLPFIKALTRGIRNLQMTWSVSQAGSTITHLIVSMADELIPAKAHQRLWRYVPPGSKGLYLKIPTTHNSVDSDPEIVAKAIDRAITSSKPPQQ